MAIVWIFVAILALMFMITVHETGHYIAAKILRFRVNEFAIGFGPAIFKHVSKKTGEIFSIRIIPLGGFCSFEGEDEAGSGFSHKKEDEDEKEEEQTPEQLRYNEKYLPYDKQSPWKRLIVLFNGAFFNYLCAIIFSVILVAAVGYYQQVKITEIDAAAHNASLRTGDIITEIDGEPFTLLNGYTKQIQPFEVSEEFTLTIIREGETQPLEITVEKGQIIKDGERYYGLGISGRIDYEKLGFVDALEKGFVFTAELAWLVLKLLFQMVTFQLSLSDLGGTFSTIAVMAQNVSSGLVNLLLLIPLVSVNLAVFNLLPIPALDGARMVFVGIEWARGKPVNPELEARIHMVGMMVLLGLVFFLDLNYLVFSKLFGG